MMQLAENLEAVNPDLTPEVMSKVDEIIARYRDMRGSLIPVLEECQAVVGYLPVELQEYIAKGLNLPGSAVYGVVSFYSFFTMVPKGRHTIKVCLGTACYVRGTRAILDKIVKKYHLDVGETTEDRRFSLEAVRCLGACGLAPVVVVDDDVHGGLVPNKILDILENYK
ncbi:MAG: NAD(P)H-dependent oxidoreductase subunit E [Deltaproteobacteria bacterium]|nr:MAG: NAD(P)H-dependent oxidoreductase subunit E [Deltaproteobacteria bacterium]